MEAIKLTANEAISFATQDIEATKRAIHKAKARRHLREFTTWTKKDYRVNWHHDIIFNEITEFLKDPTRTRLILTVGPRRGKSEIISRRLPAFALGLNPDEQIIIASYAANLANRMNRDIQKIIDSPEYHELFPDTTLGGSQFAPFTRTKPIRKSDMFEIVNRRGVLRSAGVGGGITGTGASLAIIDDPFKDWEGASSPKNRQRVKDWYGSTLYTRLSSGGKVIIIHTRWHEDDLIGHLLREADLNPEADQWEVINFPEIMDEHATNLHPMDTRKHGEVLWAEEFGINEAIKTRASVGAKIYNAMYQQRPNVDGGQIFQSKWFQYYKELPEIEYYVASWDCTFKDSSTADFVVGTVWGVCGSNKYLVYMVRDRMGIVDTMKNMLKVSKLFDLRYQLVEDKANGPAIIQMLKAKITGLLAFEPHGSKESRGNAVAPQFEAGNVWLPDPFYRPNRTSFTSVVENIDTIVNEFTSFPNGKNDDIVDSTTQALLKLGNRVEWVEELLQQSKQSSQTVVEKKNQVIAELMGWNLDNTAGMFDNDYTDILNLVDDEGLPDDTFKIDF